MKNYWNTALCISILIHTAIFIFQVPRGFWDVRKLQRIDKRVGEIENFNLEETEDLSKKEIIDINLPPPLYKENILTKLLHNNNFNNSFLEKTQFFSEKLGGIVLSEVLEDKELRNSPSYMNYYRLVREKIRENIYSLYDGKESGGVNLIFVILKNGTLENIFFTDDSFDNSYLKEITLKSLKKSAPFPVFPKELKNRDYLKFHLSIYFKKN